MKQPPARSASLADSKVASERLRWSLDACARAQLRITTARRRLLEFLAKEALPVTLEDLAAAPALAGCCDNTTVYRTLILFTAAGLVRQVNLRHKVSHFILNAPGRACDYLICQRCGSITQLPPLKSLLQLEQQVSAREGYTELRHELELYGICPACRRAGTQTRPTKLPVRV